MRNHYDVIVIGGGHAGTEAAWAAANTLRARGDEGEPGRVALITMNPSKIGVMSCNPAIGGLAKGQIVREIDALGGIMGRAIDAAGIMFKMLNTSKGAAVHGPRAQADKYAYAAEVQRLISTRDNIDVIAATVDDIVVEDGAVVGVLVPGDAQVGVADQATIDENLADPDQAKPIYVGWASPTSEALDARDAVGDAHPTLIRSSNVILTTGTFMRALMHTGETKTEGGRADEGSAVGISGTLKQLGFDLGRLKTGTPPRLARESIDWDALPAQHGDAEPIPFSDMTPEVMPRGEFPNLPAIECRITHTTAAAHAVIRDNLDRAPMYSGDIDAECGPRYCPSIEDKVVRFADRESHHVFLEPESLHTNEIYANGISTSLPADVQEQLIRTMPGCANAEILKWGYAVEYDMVRPHQIDATCMTKVVDGLFLAGQINGTSGYEEAGGQGLVAGLNAAHRAIAGDAWQPIYLGRDEAYIGVMLDDLVTKTPREPYRMFTSRAEYRLLLRADNADVRLTPRGRDLGLVGDRRWAAYEQRAATLEQIRAAFDQIFIDGKTLREVARRPDVDLTTVRHHLPGSFDTADDRLIQRIITEAKYDGYITRQRAEIKRQSQQEQRRIPAELDYDAVTGLRNETRETLLRFRPTTFGQASRLAGITPADLTILAIAMDRLHATASA